MDETRAKLVAAVVGVGLIAGFGWLGTRRGRANPVYSLEELTDVAWDRKLGIPGRMYWLSWSGIEDRDRYGALPHVPVEVSLRLVDRLGGRFVLMQGFDFGQRRAWFLPYGYDVPIESPRIELWERDRRVQSFPLASLPRPAQVTLATRPSPLFRLTCREASTLGAPTALALVPRAKPKGERWKATVVRTTTLPSARVSAADAADPRLGGGITISVPYADRAAAAEVVLKRTVVETMREEIVVPGLELVRVAGRLSASLPGPRTIHTRIGDLVLTARRSPKAPQRGSDPRYAYFDLTPSDPRGKVSFELLSPQAEAVGLNSLQVGSGSNANGRIASDAPFIPRFSARVRVTAVRERSLPPIRASAPIERQEDPRRTP